MKKREPRWYILWFFTSGMWVITFSINLSTSTALNWVIVLQFLNIFISFAAGIVNAHRYKEKHSQEEYDR